MGILRNLVDTRFFPCRNFTSHSRHASSFHRLKRFLLTCVLLHAVVIRADSVVLTGLGSFGSRKIAYLYFPENGHTAEVSLTTPQRNIQLVAIDTAKGTAQIKHDGVDQVLRLGVGMPSPSGTGEVFKGSTNRVVPSRSVEEQRKLDTEVVDRAKKLNEMDSAHLQRGRKGKE